MKKFSITLAFLITSFFYGCGQFLDMVPEKDIETIESVFEIRNGAYDFYNSCFEAVNYGLFLGNYTKDPAMICGGEYAVGEYARKPAGIGTNYLGEVLSISDGYQNTNTPYCNVWSMYLKDTPLSVYTCIRYCNIFIENIDKVNNMSMWEKKAWKAEIKCLKAFYYFEMVKRYGPIVLVPTNIQSNADIQTMQSPRSHVDTCFNTIVALFDEAIPDLRTRDENPGDFKSCFNKEAAYAYKARALLYAASPLFNGNNAYAQFKNRDGNPLFSSKYDNEKWKRAAVAADEAIAFAEGSGIRIYRGNNNLKSKKLNDITTLRYSVICTNWQPESEWIFMQVPYQIAAFHLNPIYKTGEEFANTSTFGHLAPNIATVEMFYTDNGLPITKDKTWTYANRYKMGKEVNDEYTDIVDLKGDVLNLHLRREPRFYANIMAAGTYDTFNNTKLSLVEPLKGQSRGTMAERFNDGSRPQNITGYWAKKSIEHAINPSKTTTTPNLLMRMTELYIMQAEAWNEYSGPSEKVYDAIDLIRDRAGIPPIRDAWAQFSTSPEEINTKEGLRAAIRQERKIEFVFEGHHFWDLRRWKEAENVLNRPHTGWNVMGETPEVFYNNFEQPIVVSNKPKFISPRDYFWPIKSEEVMISNIVQNPGW